MPADAHTETPEQMAARLTRHVRLLQDRLVALEEENSRFAAMLRERGVDIMTQSKMAMELPPALTAPPADRFAPILQLMKQAERNLLAELCGADEILLILKTDSIVDVGGWFVRGHLWACTTRRDLNLFASGRKPAFQKTPLASLRQSLYNHVTGEVVLAPDRELRLTRVQVAPLDGYQLLAQIYQG